MPIMLLKSLPYIGLAVLFGLAGFFYTSWQGQVKKNGQLTEQVVVVSKMNTGLNNQVTECNNKIKSSAGAAAVSYGQCQDVIKTDATVSFDRGVAFGRATCPAPTIH